VCHGGRLVIRGGGSRLRTLPWTLECPRGEAKRCWRGGPAEHERERGPDVLRLLGTHASYKGNIARTARSSTFTNR